MGADLYINNYAEKIREKNTQKFDQAVKARDSFFKTLPQDLTNVVCSFIEPSKSDLERVKKEYPNLYKRAKYLQDQVQKYYLLASGGEGYFRCSYGYNFFNHLGLSWWQDFDLLLDDNRMLPVEHAIDLVEAMRQNEIEVPTVEVLREARCTVDQNNTPEDWARYLNDHKQEFIEFLELAIHLGEPIYCSI